MSSVATQLDMLEFSNSSTQQIQYHTQNIQGQENTPNLESNKQSQGMPERYKNLSLKTDSSISTTTPFGTDGIEAYNCEPLLSVTCSLAEEMRKRNFATNQSSLECVGVLSVDETEVSCHYNTMDDERCDAIESIAHVLSTDQSVQQNDEDAAHVEFFRRECVGILKESGYI